MTRLIRSPYFTLALGWTVAAFSVGLAAPIFALALYDSIAALRRAVQEGV